MPKITNIFRNGDMITISLDDNNSYMYKLSTFDIKQLEEDVKKQKDFDILEAAREVEFQDLKTTYTNTEVKE